MNADRRKLELHRTIAAWLTAFGIGIISGAGAIVGGTMSLSVVWGLAGVLTFLGGSYLYLVERSIRNQNKSITQQ